MVTELVQTGFYFLDELTKTFPNGYYLAFVWQKLWFNNSQI